MMRELYKKDRKIILKELVICRVSYIRSSDPKMRNDERVVEERERER